MRIKRNCLLRLIGAGIALATFGCAAAGGYGSTTPEEFAMWRAAEVGNVEAQRRLAVDLSPNSPPGGAAPDAVNAAFWFREACNSRYANAAVAFLKFAENEKLRFRDPRHESPALACMHGAIEQGHRGAIRAGAVRAVTHEEDFSRAYYLYSLLSEEDPVFADQRWDIADKLISGEPERLDQRAANWRAKNTLKDDDDFLRELNAERGKGIHTTASAPP